MYSLGSEILVIKYIAVETISIVLNAVRMYNADKYV